MLNFSSRPHSFLMISEVTPSGPYVPLDVLINTLVGKLSLLRTVLVEIFAELLTTCCE